MALGRSVAATSSKSAISWSSAASMPMDSNSGTQAMSSLATSGRVSEFALINILSCRSAHSWETALTLYSGCSSSNLGMSTFIRVSFSADWAL